MTHPVPSISIDTLFPAISRKHSDIVALIKIVHPPMAQVASARTKLNVVFAIDVSGSMDQQLRNGSPLPTPVAPPRPIFFGTPQAAPGLPNIPWPGQPDPHAPYLGMPAQPMGQMMFIPTPAEVARFPTKLERVKAAAIKAISQLNTGDRFGIVTFDSSVRVVVESTLVTEQTKKQAIQSIEALRTGGSTALYAGWHAAAQMVCQNLDPKTVNRVLLLTDGEATDGIKDIPTLSKYAATMAEHGVTTSTFGVGDQYNETLLQGMAENGDGRYYYLEGDSNFEQMFVEEFQGMSRLYGSDARLRVHADNATLEFHNELPVTPQGWKLPNAIHDKVEYYLVTIKPSKVTKEAVAFSVAYDYKHEGAVQTVDVAHEVAVVTEKSFGLMKANDTVGKKQLELETARAKEKAMQALDRGDYATSKSILSASACTIGASAYAAAPEFLAQSARLESLMAVGDSGDHRKLRKMSSHDTYATRNNYGTDKT